ncbi:MAG: DUF2769 domain-containing protein [Candidatus Methanoperedens sp.]|nr:DUF2769 domain-containing protein [Candidatus Methanoperedens sp.]
MDKYEASVAQIMKMGDKEREEMVAIRKKLCICGRCPTYNDCAQEKKEIWYCALGKSPECIKGKMGCICPKCPIFEDMGLKKSYFCVRGSEREQRGM